MYKAFVFFSPIQFPVCKLDMIPYANQTLWINHLENSH